MGHTVNSIHVVMFYRLNVTLFLSHWVSVWMLTSCGDRSESLSLEVVSKVSTRVLSHRQIGGPHSRGVLSVKDKHTERQQR